MSYSVQCLGFNILAGFNVDLMAFAEHDVVGDFSVCRFCFEFFVLDFKQEFIAAKFALFEVIVLKKDEEMYTLIS